MTSGNFTIVNRQVFQDRILRDSVFHRQVLDQLKALPRKGKKARELRKHYESIPKYLREQTEPRERVARVEEQLQCMKLIGGAEASRNPSQKAHTRGSGQSGRKQASDGIDPASPRPHTLIDESQAQQDTLAGIHPAPPHQIPAEGATQPGGMLQPEASAAQPEASAANKTAQARFIKLIRLIATNKATKDQLRLFEKNVVIQGPGFHRLIDHVEQIYDKSSSSTAEAAQLKLARVLTAIRIVRLVLPSPLTTSSNLK